MKFFQEWLPFDIIPYGIDNNSKLIEQARKIFPRDSKNFLLADFWKISGDLSGFLDRNNVEESFDFIYWAVWDNILFRNQKEITTLKNLYNIIKPNGRLILGFYKPGSMPDNSDNKKKIPLLIKKLEIDPSETMENSHENIIIWFDK